MLLFLDGMAHYDTTRLAAKYSALDTTAVTWSITAEGRVGNCIKRASTSNSGLPGYLSVAPLTTRLGPWVPAKGGVCGFAIKIDDVSRAEPTQIGSSASGLLEVWEGSMYHILLQLNADGTLSLIRHDVGSGGGIVVLAQSTEGLTSNTWLFVECQWVIDETTGSVVVRINGVPVLTYTGRTREHMFQTTLGVWNAVRVGRVSSKPPPYLVLRICDVYLADLAFSTPDDVHDFLGDGAVITILPNAPGAASGWTPSAGLNWDTQNDRPAPDDDATYVVTNTVGVSDLYHFEDIPAGALVKGAQLNILARKETNGAAALAPLVQPPGFGPLTGPTQGVANVLYDRYLTQPYDLNPATGVRFTAADINAGQFGVTKVT